MNRNSTPHQAQLSFTMEPLKSESLPLKKIAPRKTTAKKKEKENLPLETDGPKIMTVTEVTRRVATLLEEGIGEVWIEGEISNYRLQSSGHHYFTLKDEGSQIACVLFARTAASLRNLSSLRLADGLAVQIHGSVTVYQPRGQYQLMVRLIQPKGQGVLQAKFEALKQKLATEGLFDTARKRPLPHFPQRIGVVTSPTGAALADFLNVLHRRHPGLRVVIHPVRVQGRGAAQEIANAITELASGSTAIGPIDVIVVTRGGGSLEDLWEFNEEVVARAIVASSVPVVSAVGHEIDFTICDFAADLRAPTPSAAAELLAADGVAVLENIKLLVARIGREAITQKNNVHRKMEYLQNSILFREPERLFWQLRQSLDRVSDGLEAVTQRRFRQMSSMLETMAAVLRAHHPRHLITQAQQRQGSLKRQLDDQLRHRRQLSQAQLERLRSSLAALNPQATLARGFTITRNGAGTVLTSSKQVSKRGLLRTQFIDGTVDSVVEEMVLVKREIR